MIIKESLEVSGSKIRGKIDSTVSKGNVLLLNEIFGLSLSKTKELSIEDMLGMKKELEIVIGKMCNSELTKEEHD